MNIDWSKAPEGATHVTKGGLGCWYKKHNGTWYYDSCVHGWLRSENTDEWRETHLIARPVEWRGPQDGLPPVGTVCWLSLGMETGGNVQITYIGDGVFCYKKQRTGQEFTGFTTAALFSPIQSERDKAIDEMMADLAASEKCPYKTTKLMVAHNREACETLYNAGYRKGEPK